MVSASKRNNYHSTVWVSTFPNNIHKLYFTSNLIRVAYITANFFEKNAQLNKLKINKNNYFAMNNTKFIIITIPHKPSNNPLYLIYVSLVPCR